MAQFAFEELVRRAGLQDDFTVDSAATSREEIGNPPLMWQHLLEQIYERIRPASLNSTGLM